METTFVLLHDFYGKMSFVSGGKDFLQTLNTQIDLMLWQEQDQDYFLERPNCLLKKPCQAAVAVKSRSGSSSAVDKRPLKAKESSGSAAARLGLHEKLSWKETAIERSPSARNSS